MATKGGRLKVLPKLRLKRGRVKAARRVPKLRLAAEMTLTAYIDGSVNWRTDSGRSSFVRDQIIKKIMLRTKLIKRSYVGDLFWPLLYFFILSL